MNTAQNLNVRNHHLIASLRVISSFWESIKTSIEDFTYALAKARELKRIYDCDPGNQEALRLALDKLGKTPRQGRGHNKRSCKC